MIGNYDLLLLDAANTIIHKPKLWVSILDVLRIYGYDVTESDLRRNHKLLSEMVHFPDRTDANFYKNFNREVLLSLGIVPTDKMLDDVFAACSYLPWAMFDDTVNLNELNVEIAVISNFKNSLVDELNQLFGDIFANVVTSESLGIGKPSETFYRKAIEILRLDVSKVLYIGDSLKLDIIPAKSIGISSLLIDREDNFPYFPQRISSFDQLLPFFQ